MRFWARAKEGWLSFWLGRECRRHSRHRVHEVYEEFAEVPAGRYCQACLDEYGGAELKARDLL